MKVKGLEIENFRNIERAKMTAGEGMNILVGENAQGKTNLLEAVWLFSGAKSFRRSADCELIRFGCERAALSMTFFAKKREQTAKIEIEKIRTATLNNVDKGAAKALAGEFYCIIFSPDDIALITGSPSVRRRMVDVALGQIYPEYINYLKNYTRAVQQRNSLLKDLRYNSSLFELLEDFETAIAENGVRIIRHRMDYIGRLAETAPEIYAGLSRGREKMTVEYSATAGPDMDEFIQKLAAARGDDMKTLTTSIGPHRDDVKVDIDGTSARSFGSQGQKRSAALSLKLGEAEMIKSLSGEQPVALLDDVMSELDEGRQNYVLNHIKNWQVFLTCCDRAAIKNLREGVVFSVKDGRVREEK